MKSIDKEDFALLRKMIYNNIYYYFDKKKKQELIDYAEARGIKWGGTKSDIIEQIEEYLIKCISIDSSKYFEDESNNLREIEIIDDIDWEDVEILNEEEIIDD